MSTRTNRFSTSFAPLRTPSQTMRSLKTAFSPTRSSRSQSTTSYSSTISTSPLTHQSPSSYSPDSYRPSGGSYSRNSSPQSSRSAHSLAEILAVRRRPSTLEFEMQMERRAWGSEMAVLEPRPVGAEFAGCVGIFEVLDGKC
jgi:hypothetical protein